MSQNILLLDKTNIKSGKLAGLVPELYDLKNAIENSKDKWHQHESVFNHTLSVMSALDKILLKYKNLKKILDQKIDKNTRKTLLKISAIFHDIGKKETMVHNDSFTSCAGHEKIGVKMAKKILKRFDISDKEINWILHIIGNHSEIHWLLMPNNQNFKKNFINLKRKFSKTIYPELILLSFADTVNSKLKKEDVKEFNYRINFYKAETESLKI